MVSRTKSNPGVLAWQLVRLLVSTVALFTIAKAHADERLPANFVWCDCICGNYNPLDYVCVVSVPDKHVSISKRDCTVFVRTGSSYKL